MTEQYYLVKDAVEKLVPELLEREIGPLRARIAVLEARRPFLYAEVSNPYPPDLEKPPGQLPSLYVSS